MYRRNNCRFSKLRARGTLRWQVCFRSYSKLCSSRLFLRGLQYATSIVCNKDSFRHLSFSVLLFCSRFWSPTVTLRITQDLVAQYLTLLKKKRETKQYPSLSLVRRWMTMLVLQYFFEQTVKRRKPDGETPVNKEHTAYIIWDNIILWHWGDKGASLFHCMLRSGQFATWSCAAGISVSYLRSDAFPSSDDHRSMMNGLRLCSGC